MFKVKEKLYKLNIIPVKASYGLLLAGEGLIISGICGLQTRPQQNAEPRDPVCVCLDSTAEPDKRRQIII